MALTEEQIEESFEGEAGGFFDGVEIAIAGATFGYDSNYNDGNSEVWKPKFVINDAGVPVEPEFSPIYPVGADWEIQGDGESVVNKRNSEKRKFKGQTWYQKFIEAAVEAGAKKVMLERKLPSTDAKLFVGMKFRVEEKTVDYGGEIGKKSRPLPVEFLGVIDGKASKSKKSTQRAETQSEEGTQESVEIPKAIQAKLKSIAKKVKADGGDFDAFYEKVLNEVSAVEENDAVGEWVLDEESGPWGQAE